MNIFSFLLRHNQHVVKAFNSNAIQTFKSDTFIPTRIELINGILDKTFRKQIDLLTINLGGIIRKILNVSLS